MKKNNKEDSSNGKGGENIGKAITRVAQTLAAWQGVLTGGAVAGSDPQKDFAEAILDASRILAGMNVVKCPLGQIQNSSKQDFWETVEDIAADCLLSIQKSADRGKNIFAPGKVRGLTLQSIAEGKPTVGESSGLNAYLYTTLYRQVWKSLRKQIKAKKLEINDPILMRRAASVIDDVGERICMARRLEIEAAVLDSITYRGKPLRQSLGGWKPMLEWTELRTMDERPPEEAISKRALQRVMTMVREALRADRTREAGPEM